MGVNLDKPQQWKADIAQSVDMFNEWFMNFAPAAFRTTRIQTTKDVEATLRATDNLTHIQPAVLRKYPEVLPTLRMSTCPPLAVDRLIGLAGVPNSMVKRMENEEKLPVRRRGSGVLRYLRNGTRLYGPYGKHGYRCRCQGRGSWPDGHGRHGEANCRRKYLLAGVVM